MFGGRAEAAEGAESVGGAEVSRQGEVCKRRWSLPVGWKLSTGRMFTGRAEAAEGAESVGGAEVSQQGEVCQRGGSLPVGWKLSPGRKFSGRAEVCQRYGCLTAGRKLSAGRRNKRLPHAPISNCTSSLLHTFQHIVLPQQTCLEPPCQNPTKYL